MDAVMKELKMGMERRGMRFLEEAREWRLPGLLYVYVFVLCDDSVEDLRTMMGRFVEVYRRRDLKVNAGKNKVMILNAKEGLECEVSVDWIQLEHMSEFKYLGCVLDELGVDEAEIRRRVVSGRMVAYVTRSPS